MYIPLLDLSRQYDFIKEYVDEAIEEVLASQRFIGGPKVEACEKEVATYCECAYGVGVSSGSDALLIALMAEEIGPGDEVVTTPYTFFATAGAIARVGATPVFVDIDPVTYNLDPTQIQDAITDKTRAIIPVHLFGQMLEMSPLLAISRKYGLVVIEDAAQAIGARYRRIYNRNMAGSMGDYGCFSFFPTKNLGCFGDGGMVITNDKERAEKLKILRSHGASPKYHHALVGGNFRLDALQAAIVLAKLPFLDSWIKRRQDNASRYNNLFSSSSLIDRGKVELPEIVTERHVFNQYVIRAKQRDALRSFLKEQGIATEVYYPVPLHLQKCFAYLNYASEDFPVSEQAANVSLALPIFPELTDDEAVYIVEKILAFYQN